MASLADTRAEKVHEEMQRRKMSPIYDCLDSGNFKGALKMCDKKDIANWDLTLALKAHALERLGKSTEALELCRLVKGHKPTDSSTLSALALNFKLLDLGAEAAELFENGLELQPHNADFAQEAYFSHVRLFNYAKQQQYAMKLFKQISSAHFVFWSAAAMLLQARSGGGAMLVLSERMVKRVLDSRLEKGNRPSGEEFRLYLALLKQQSKLDQALSAVIAHGNGESPLGSTEPAAEAAKIQDEGSLAATGVPSEFLMMQPEERLESEAKLRLEVGDAAGALAAFTRLVAHSPEQWAYHVGYLDALFCTAPPKEGAGVERDELVAQARNRCWQLQEANAISRAPYLLELELLKRWDNDSLPEAWIKDGVKGTARLEALSTLVVAYLKRFGSKPCCFHDLEPYLRSVAGSSTTAAEAIDKLMVEVTPGKDGELAARIKTLHMYVACCQCRRFLGAHATMAAPQLRAEAEHLFQVYRETLDLNVGSAGGEREVQHGDELLLLAVHVLRDLWTLLSKDQTGGSNRAVFACELDAAFILEYGSFHLTIMAMEVYRSMGAFEAGVRLFNTLQVRHVQLDSLSWLLLPGAAASGLFTEAQQQCRDVMRFHRSAARDAGDYSVKALESGNYTKAVALAEFHTSRMVPSMQLHLARADFAHWTLLLTHHAATDAVAYLEAVQAARLRESPQPFEDDALSVNHDWSIVSSWDHADLDRNSRRRSDMLRRLKLRRALPRVLLCCLQGDASSANLAAAASELSALQEELPSDSEEWPGSTCEKLCVSMASLTAAACLSVMGDSEVKEPDAILELVACVGRLAVELAPCSGSDDLPGALLAPWLERVCCFVEEGASCVCLAAQAIVKRTEGSKKSKNKKGKKGTTGQDSALAAAAQSLSEATTGLFKQLKGALEDRKASLLPGSLAKNFTEETTNFPALVASDFDEARAKVFGAVASSHTLSVERLVQVIDAKLGACGTL